MAAFWFEGVLFFGLFQHRRAVRAAGRVVGNLALAERADALGLGRSGFRLLVDLVHRADDEEHAERGQDEVDDVLDEQAVVDRADAGRRGRLGGNVAAAVERDEQAAEVDAAGQHADQRHEDVVDQRRGDRAERRADDDADGHVDHIAAHGERLEILEEFFHGYLSSLFYALSGSHRTAC